jgi:SAM-dependent methyltransferase
MRLERAKWDRFYSAPEHGRRRASRLVRQIARREQGLGSFIDLGCGRGVDAAWMARQGVTSWGLDFSAKAYRERERRNRPGLRFQLFNLLELRHVVAVSASAARLPGPRVIMARHVVDAVGARARENLWRTGSTVLREPGDRLYLEFCTRAGDDGYAQHHRVGTRSPRRIVRELEAAGGTVVRRKVLLTSPDTPETSSQVCRIVATWER